MTDAISTQVATVVDFSAYVCSQALGTSVVYVTPFTTVSTALTPVAYALAAVAPLVNEPPDTVIVGYVYATASIGNVNSLFRNLNRDFAQTYESNKTTYETRLEELIDKLDEISFLG